MRDEMEGLVMTVKYEEDLGVDHYLDLSKYGQNEDQDGGGISVKRPKLELVEDGQTDCIWPPAAVVWGSMSGTQGQRPQRMVNVRKMELNFFSGDGGRSTARTSSESGIVQPTMAQFGSIRNEGQLSRLSETSSRLIEQEWPMNKRATASTDELFRCPMCSEIVKSIREFWKHYSQVHFILKQQLPTEKVIRTGFAVNKAKPRTVEKKNNVIKNTEVLLNCLRCLTSFQNIADLQNHMALKHLDYLTSKGIVSSKSPSSTSNMDTRSRSPATVSDVVDVSSLLNYSNGDSENKVLKKYRCAVCRSKFQNQNDLSIHVSVRHSDPLQIGYTCDVCSNSEVFDSEDTLRTHYKVFHAQSGSSACNPDERTSISSIEFRCAHDSCPHLVFKGQSIFADHCRRFHDEDGNPRVDTELKAWRYFCHFCKLYRDYKWNSEMRGHIVTSHKQVLETIHCKECIIVSGSDLLFRFHRLSHTQFWRDLNNDQKSLMEQKICYSDQVVIKCPLPACKYLAPFTMLDEFEHHVRSRVHTGLKFQNNEKQDEDRLTVRTPVVDSEVTEIELEPEDDEIEFLGVVGKDCDGGIFPDM